MFRPIWTFSTFIHAVLQRCAPTNMVLGHIRRRRGLKWGIPAMLLALPYLVAASLCSPAIGDGAPGWLNLVILLCVWNAMKFIVAGPVSVVLLLRARGREAVARRASERANAAVELVAA